MSIRAKIVYDKEDSPFLKMTEIWFKNKNIEYDKINVSNMEENFKNIKNSGFNDKYPKILINDNVINGYSELIKKESYVLFLLGIYEVD